MSPAMLLFVINILVINYYVNWYDFTNEYKLVIKIYFKSYVNMVGRIKK